MAAQREHGARSRSFGDPASDGAVIWTRATIAAGSGGCVALTRHVAPVGSAKAVRTGKVIAKGPADHIAKVAVTGLKPAAEYDYRFVCKNCATSPKGRLRTLPVGAADKMVMALVSCQFYAGGFFNAYPPARERLYARLRNPVAFAGHRQDQCRS